MAKDVNPSTDYTREIAERENQIDQLLKIIREMALKDALTGIYNHANFHERLQSEIARAQRFSSQVSLILIDIDDFRKFNEQHGHIVGDQALVVLGQIVRTYLRKYDIPARYGGEEFAIILPDATLEDAQKVAERIRQTVLEREIATGHATTHFSISSGIAHFPSHADSSMVLVACGEAALQQAKQSGKNRVEIFVP
ncbi:MAG: GGDEF domain-containing protein [Acidobacteriia bacterium]|nr:GGDEF domain-containing protein [Terriglobia bacterium]